MNLLLSENLPLRTTRMLGDFADDQVLPQRFGDLRASPFKLIKLSPSEWFAADHYMPLNGVQIDQESTAGWDQVLRTDDKGNAWTVVRLAAPAPPDAIVSATGTGRQNPVTGRLMENPAEIIEYLLRLAGRAEIFPQLRAEAAAAGLVLAGSLDRAQSIRAWIDEIAYSAGAIWTHESARLYPTTNVSGPILSLDKLAAIDIEVDEVLEDTADVLRVSYDMNDATGRPQRYIELSASPQRFGGIVAEVVLRWVRTPSNAESIGRRILQRMAGLRYDVFFSTNRTQARPCQWSRLVAHPQWPFAGADPTPMILETDIASDTKSVRVKAEYIASTPLITVTAYSVALPPDIGASIEVARTAGVVTLTIRDNNGQVLKAAKVSLDGGPAKVTDTQGRVSFTASPGKHLLAIESAGMVPMQLEIEL